MAKTTNSALRNQIIYSIFVRNFSAEGTFRAVIPQLDRLKAMGVDIIWLMPIHPLGEMNRKGKAGSPYAIKDYRAVNPAFGTLEDFKQLCDEIHQRGMKVMIDVVYNHTAPDAVLVAEHPEWYYYKADGTRGNRVGDWTDIVDLDYRHYDLWEYQIETLMYWAQFVDGFRCDVAPLVPIEFWLAARDAVATVKADVVWLAESIHLEFIREMRGLGVLAQSDGEMYQAFDITYDYDVRDAFDAYLADECPLSYFVERLNLQETIYPANYIKLRNLENHDNPRIKRLIPNSQQLLQWTAFLYFQKGATLLYNGQEVQAAHVPTLFDIDPIEWQFEHSISDYLIALAKIKRTHIPDNSLYRLTAQDDTNIVMVQYTAPEAEFIGLCALKGHGGAVTVPFPDGHYVNLVNQEMVAVINQQVIVGESAVALVRHKKEYKNRN